MFQISSEKKKLTIRHGHNALRRNETISFFVSFWTRKPLLNIIIKKEIATCVVYMMQPVIKAKIYIKQKQCMNK